MLGAIDLSPVPPCGPEYRPRARTKADANPALSAGGFWIGAFGANAGTIAVSTDGVTFTSPSLRIGISHQHRVPMEAARTGGNGQA